MSSYTKGVAWQGQPLPRGRHKLDPEEVRESQRRRISRAMLEVVAEQGYEAATVSQVVAAARVSRNAFYEFFSDKTDCFLTLSEELADEILQQLVDTDAGDWISALRAGLKSYLNWWQDRPVWTRAYLVELPAAGPRAVAQRDRQYGRFVAMFDAVADWARREQPELPPLPPLNAKLIVLAVTELLAERVRREGASNLLALEDDLLYWIVLMLADEATARRVAGVSR